MDGACVLAWSGSLSSSWAPQSPPKGSFGFSAAQLKHLLCGPGCPESTQGLQNLKSANSPLFTFQSELHFLGNQLDSSKLSFLILLLKKLHT